MACFLVHHCLQYVFPECDVDRLPVVTKGAGRCFEVGGHTSRGSGGLRPPDAGAYL